MRIRRAADRPASVVRRIGLVLVLGLLAAVLPMLHPGPVAAASGVDDYPSRLKNAPQDSLVDPWQFYNRECTSFVAWRLNSENQVAFNDYWQGQHWGNASNWKKAAVALGITVDNKPNRGAVAWWAAGSAGSSRGHVAWVQTVGNGAITIEEYNYLHRGRYDTRTISSSSSLWPSGFIHVKDTQLRITDRPTVSGTPQVGKKLTSSHGTWNLKHLTFAYQWLADGKAIAGATSKSYTPTASQLGKRIRARVTASKSGARTGTANTAATDGVAKGVFVNSSPPTVNGTAQVGVPLAANLGTWSPSGTFSYQWYAGSKAIAGATSAGFTPTADQLGAGLTVRVSLSAPGYQTLRVRSRPTSAVAPGQFTAGTPPTITGVAQVDHPLRATPGTWSPSGSLHYQWLADGQPISGATATSYTPEPGDLRKTIAVQVTVHRRGYVDAVAASTATLGVAPGTFLNTAPPSVSGTAQVGVPLTASPGRWSPSATFHYQWLVDGAEVTGATGRTFTPRAEDLGHKISVEVRASRPAYLTATVHSLDTADVVPGVMHRRTAPVVTGQPAVGKTLRATTGTWSPTPDSYRYQWYAGSTAISGATGATYRPTSDDAGLRLHVVVTAVKAGYTDAPAASSSTDKVVFGHVSMAKPTIRGRALVGRTLRAHVDDVVPSTATPSYRWFLGHEQIRGAHEATYVVQPGDLGHRIHVEVTMRAVDWVTNTRRSAATPDVRTRPRLHVHTSLRDGRVLLRLSVTAPGLTRLDGRASVWLRKQRVGRFEVTDGHGSRLLAPLRRGTRILSVVYRGGPHETVGRKTVTVTVP